MKRTRPDEMICHERWDREMFLSIRASTKLGKEVRCMIENIGTPENFETIPVVYSTKNGDPCGRIYGNLNRLEGGCSLQTLPRGIRRLLSHKYYNDYDMSNCAPTLMRQLMERNNLPVPHLINYIEKRKEIYKKYTDTGKFTEDEVKTAFLSILHMGNANPLLPETIILRREMEGNFKKMTTLNDEYIDLYRGTIERKYNRLGSFAARLWQRVENQILEMMRAYFVLIGYAYDRMVLCFDGLMLQKDTTVTEAVNLKDMEKLILDKTGYAVVILEKSLLPTEEDSFIITK